MIYTDKNYGKQNGKMDTSLKDSGKSRADLWAFATLSAAEWLMEQNNKRCDATKTKDLHLYNEPTMNLSFTCKVKPSRKMVFQSGRIDCPESDKPSAHQRLREYQTDKAEACANPHASGKDIADWMSLHFGFTGRETVAIMGAHQAGVYHNVNTGFRYTW